MGAGRNDADECDTINLQVMLLHLLKYFKSFPPEIVEFHDTKSLSLCPLKTLYALLMSPLFEYMVRRTLLTNRALLNLGFPCSPPAEKVYPFCLITLLFHLYKYPNGTVSVSYLSISRNQSFINIPSFDISI